MVVVEHDLSEIDIFLLQSKNLHGITDVNNALKGFLHYERQISMPFSYDVKRNS